MTDVTHIYLIIKGESVKVQPKVK